LGLPYVGIAPRWQQGNGKTEPGHGGSATPLA
jgi:hypothetical protein